ncbi:hypothetical protein GGI07_000751 [Coemansia sp. Benny D115]|nr:hypothetical protein GGI07_000751 [Coemansia sp. Benny D115]
MDHRNPNINNGFQIDSSVIVGGGGIDGSEAPEPAAQGGSNFANVVGASFTEVNSNSANKDNIVINASTTTVNGDSGDTTNGVGNNIGDTQHTSGGLARRDVVFNNGGHLPPHHVVAVEPVFAPFVVPPFSGEFVHFVGPAVGGVPYGFY